MKICYISKRKGNEKTKFLNVVYSICMQSSEKLLWRTTFHREKVIPSQSFFLKGEEFLLLKIIQREQGVFLKLLGLGKKYLGNIYLVPQSLLETQNNTEDALLEKISSYLIH